MCQEDANTRDPEGGLAPPLQAQLRFTLIFHLGQACGHAAAGGPSGLAGGRHQGPRGIV